MRQVLKVCQRLVLGLLMAAILPACRSTRSPEMPLTTVVVEEEPQIAPAAPLQVERAPTHLPPAPTPSWISLENWGNQQGLAKPVQIALQPSPTYAIRYAQTELAIQVGSRLAYWNGLACWLGFAPQLLDGLPQIHLLDATKSLQPLLRRANRPSGAPRTVVIDPGHGGRDPGTASCLHHRYEKEYTLDWALRLEKLLRARGWKVFLTRSTDVELSLGERTLLADRVKADLFLSLHFNSGSPKRELAGIETYCLTPVGMPSSMLRYAENDLTQSWPNNAFDEENMVLASRLHEQLIRQTSAPDRGVRRARFMSVLREQKRPAVLIEGGYLSNPEEAAKIQTPAYRQQLASAVAEALE